MEELVKEYKELLEKRKEIDERLKEIREILRENLEPGEPLVTEHGVVVYSVYTTRRLDMQRLKLEKPEIYEEYTLEKEAMRVSYYKDLETYKRYKGGKE